jgi:hypothetical protein
MQTTLRNSSAAYRQFRSSGLIAGAHGMVVEVLRHKLFGGLIALMGIAGFAGIFVTFWP